MCPSHFLWNQVFNVDTSDIQGGQRPIIVIKDKNNSLLILHSGTVAVETVTGGIESSADINETFNFCAEVDLFIPHCL